VELGYLVILTLNYDNRVIQGIVFCHVFMLFFSRLNELKNIKMNKVELIDHIAVGADISSLAAEQVLNSLIQNVIHAVSNDEIVQIIGLGSFAATERSARIGRNPSTGALVQIQASRSVKFRAGSAFKAAVNAEPFDFS